MCVKQIKKTKYFSVEFSFSEIKITVENVSSITIHNMCLILYTWTYDYYKYELTHASNCILIISLTRELKIDKTKKPKNRN